MTFVLSFCQIHHIWPRNIRLFILEGRCLVLWRPLLSTTSLMPQVSSKHWSTTPASWAWISLPNWSHHNLNLFLFRHKLSYGGGKPQADLTQQSQQHQHQQLRSITVNNYTYPYIPLPIPWEKVLGRFWNNLTLAAFW